MRNLSALILGLALCGTAAAAPQAQAPASAAAQVAKAKRAPRFVAAGRINMEMGGHSSFEPKAILLKVSKTSALGTPDHYIVVPGSLAGDLKAKNPNGLYSNDLAVKSGTLQKMPSEYGAAKLEGFFRKGDRISLYQGALDGLRITPGSRR